MDKFAGNAIQRARLRSGHTQESLAELAGYSVDSIRAWENGSRSCPLDALGILTEILGANWLTGVYLREQSHRGQLDELIPDFTVGRPLSEAGAEFISLVLEFTDERLDRRLLRMVADGRIDDSEQAIYDEILDLGAKLNRAYFELLFAGERGKEGPKK